MIKRIGIFLTLIILVLSLCAVAIYYINPWEVKTENVRPRIFGADIYRIPSQSMQPLLMSGDIISVSHITYREESPKRNDVVVFYKPTKKVVKTKIPYIKRVLAVAGDTLKIKNAIVYVNEKAVIENYVLDKYSKKSYSKHFKKIQVAENSVFVLGDNRDNSSDSRIYGAVKINDIIGKATVIVYGINDRSGKEIQ